MRQSGFAARAMTPRQPGLRYGLLSREGGPISDLARVSIGVTHYTEEEAGLAYLAVALYADSPDGKRYIEFQLADEDDRDWAIASSTDRRPRSSPVTVSKGW